MARKSKRAKLNLTDEQRAMLTKLSQSRTAQLREVQRANILLAYAQDMDISTIAKQIKTTRSTVYKCIDKALSMGVDRALKDAYHRPREPVIREEDKNGLFILPVQSQKTLDMPQKHGVATLLHNT